MQGRRGSGGVGREIVDCGHEREMRDRCHFLS